VYMWVYLMEQLLESEKLFTDNWLVWRAYLHLAFCKICAPPYGKRTFANGLREPAKTVVDVYLLQTRPHFVSKSRVVIRHDVMRRPVAVNDSRQRHQKISFMCSI
jgi:hypothetical protein